MLGNTFLLVYITNRQATDYGPRTTDHADLRCAPRPRLERPRLESRSALARCRHSPPRDRAEDHGQGARREYRVICGTPSRRRRPFHRYPPPPPPPPPSPPPHPPPPP